MLASRKILWIVIPLLLIVGLPAFVYFVIYDHRNEPFCHKVLFLGFVNYFDEQKIDVLPNVGGRSADSITAMLKYWGDEPWSDTYRYVPGLKKGDPGDLVLMYMPVPTRYIWHNNPQTIFAENKWILIPLDFRSNASLMVLLLRQIAKFHFMARNASEFHSRNYNRV